MLVNLREVLDDAKKNHYAVGMFNTINLEIARGVIEAAEETRSPVIVGTAELLTRCSSTLEEVADILIPMAKRATVPVVLHLDHGYKVEVIRKAMEIGFTSIMYDCSAMPFEENIKNVADIVKEAHKLGVSVEGELGHVGSAENEAFDANVFTVPSTAREFVERTDVDALAVSVGNAHGTYKTAPKLQFDLIKEIADYVKVPLVMHGGSGIPDEDFASAIQLGIAKANIYTDLNNGFGQATQQGYSPAIGYMGMFLRLVGVAKKIAIEKMKVFGSCGKA